MPPSRLATHRKSREFKYLALPLLFLALSPLAQAQNTGTKEALYASSLAATCANCHGPRSQASTRATSSHR
jgi:mono/diheme cytochrome c family protein